VMAMSPPPAAAAAAKQGLWVLKAKELGARCQFIRAQALFFLNDLLNLRSTTANESK
jgi:hypothetical protein